MWNFQIFFHKSDLNKTFNQLLTDLYLINHLTIYRANIAHQKEATYELLKESKICIKFSNYGLYSTPIALYSMATDTSKLQPAPLWNLIHVPPKIQYM